MSKPKIKIHEIDPESYENYKNELARLEEKLVVVREEKNNARTDCINAFENPIYMGALESEAHIIEEIDALQADLLNFKVVTTNTDPTIIHTGDTFRVECIEADYEPEIRQYKLVSSSYPRIFDGEITPNSPIGSALHHSKVGTSVIATLDNGEKVILKILEKV